MITARVVTTATCAASQAARRARENASNHETSTPKDQTVPAPKKEKKEGFLRRLFKREK